MALCRLTGPCPPFFQQRKKCLPKGMPPAQVTPVKGVTTPSSSAPVATATLEVTVKRERERPAGAVRLLLQHPDAAAERIHLHLLVTGLAAQVLVEGFLEARLADHVATQVVALVLRELALAHLTDVAEEMRA